MTKTQLWEFLTQLKGLIQQNPQQARQLLINNPSLTKAVFQTQIILGLTQTPQKAPTMIHMQAPMQQAPGGMPTQQAFPTMMMGAPMVPMNGAGMPAMYGTMNPAYGGMQMPQGMGMPQNNMNMDPQNQQGMCMRFL